MFNRMLLIAHRGYSASAPENTFAAFDMALQLGYKDVEFDVQLSRDGVPVIIHDETLERTTNGVGRVADTTCLELSMLDAGSWFDKKFAGQRIPTLEDFLIRYRGKAHLHLEIKSTEPELPGKIADLLVLTGWTRNIGRQSPRSALRRPKLIISSYEPDQILRAMKLIPRPAQFELLVEKVSAESMRWAAENGMRSYHPDGADITPELVQTAKKLGLHVGAWWWTEQEQDARAVARHGGRYAYVNAPRLHRHPVRRKSEALLHKT